MEMEANRSVERPEMEVRVETALELAGAEEGAAALERAIGKAKALGRDFGRLEKQLAKAREGVRRFRLAHPGGGGVLQGMQNAECKMQNENEEAGQDGGFPPLLRPEETRLISDVAEVSAVAGPSSFAWPSAFAKATADESEDRTEDRTTDKADCRLEEESSQGSTESRPTGEEEGEDGRGSEESGSKLPHSTGSSAAALEDGGMEERERGRPEHSQAEEDRLAAVESRLQRLEERARVHRDI
jgi:hypothetical protein